MTTTQTASERITEEVTSWPGVEAGTGSRGEFGFRVGGHEIGHLHDDARPTSPSAASSAPSSRPRGGSSTTPCSPASPGPGATAIEGAEDVDEVIALMRLNYDRVVERYGLSG